MSSANKPAQVRVWPVTIFFLSSFFFGSYLSIPELIKIYYSFYFVFVSCTFFIYNLVHISRGISEIVTITPFIGFLVLPLFVCSQ